MIWIIFLPQTHQNRIIHDNGGVGLVAFQVFGDMLKYFFQKMEFVPGIYRHHIGRKVTTGNELLPNVKLIQIL